MGEKIEVTQEMLERALLCCAKDDPAMTGHDPCADCYLQQMHLVKDGHVSTGETCFMHLAQETIAYIRRINDFEHSQCAKLLAKNGELEHENAQLHIVVEQMDPVFFTRKCRACGCDWHHPCEGGCSWVGDDLCSKCFGEMLRKVEGNG